MFIVVSMPAMLHAVVKVGQNMAELSSCVSDCSDALVLLILAGLLFYGLLCLRSQSQLSIFVVSYVLSYVLQGFLIKL